ncbi:hypothetical protein SAMN02910456_02337 [Ruminococcaceae bacterium YRB3002]|nr:hypothetical protein SAMN02910456_02337 [Ruminococcaceae bacterium YRB3002]
MRKLRSAVALILIAAMSLSLAACGGVKEYNKDSFVSVLKNDLKIADDQIYEAENDGTQNNFPVATIVTAKYNESRINAYFCQDASKAKAYFDERFQHFQDTFDKNNQFKGSSVTGSTDNSGYIVIKGDMPGTDLFGALYQAGSVYGGLYYSGNMIIMVLSDNTDGYDDVEAFIKAMGLPNV